MKCQKNNCNAKVPMGMEDAFRCKCGLVYCNKHRMSETHDCTYDYKAAGQTALLSSLPKVVANKVVPI